jgi:hypothetical protein
MLVHRRFTNGQINPSVRYRPRGILGVSRNIPFSWKMALFYKKGTLRRKGVRTPCTLPLELPLNHVINSI